MGMALADHASAKQSAFDMVALHRRFRRERKRRMRAATRSRRLAECALCAAICLVTESMQVIDCR